MSISEWSEDSRPREKLLNAGAQSLTDAELLAIFLRVGVKGMNVIELAESMLAQFGSLNLLFNAHFDELSTVKGIGVAKYVQMQAVLEMSKRYLLESATDSCLLDSPQSVRHYLHHLLKNEPYEQFILVHLDNQHKVIEAEVLFKGTIDSAAVYPRVVLDSIIKHKSAAVIFAHNHPSGICEPSQADISLTKRLKEVLNLIDVRTLDHFVVGYDEVVSFAERGLI